MATVDRKEIGSVPLKTVLRQFPIEQSESSSSDGQLASASDSEVSTDASPSADYTAVKNADAYFVFGSGMIRSGSEVQKIQLPPGLDLPIPAKPRPILGTYPNLAEMPRASPVASMGPMSPMAPMTPMVPAAAVPPIAPDHAPVGPTLMSPTAAQMDAMQKRLNQQIVEAAKVPKAEAGAKLLALAEENIDKMNAVNLSTALHRLARAWTNKQGKGQKSLARHPVVSRMVDLAENFAERELQNRDNSMPANCCTIIAWSCSSLSFFRSSLFAVLVKVASRGVEECQSFEITNLMWALAELCRRRPQMGKELSLSIQELVLATAPVFMKWQLHTLNVRVLTSALMSLAFFPPMDLLAHGVLIAKIVLELAVRDEELASENQVVVAAFQTLSRNHSSVYRDVLRLCQQTFPQSAAHRLMKSRPSNKTRK